MDPTLERQIPSTLSTISLEVHNSIQDQDLREISKDSLLTQTDHPQDSTIEIILTIRVIDSQEREILLEISTTIGKTTPHSKEETSRPTEITITLKRETSTHPEIKLIEDLLILNPKQTEETSLIITEKYLSKLTKNKETSMTTETREQIISSKTSMKKMKTK